MGKISKYFTREEVVCRCGCGFDTMDAETLKIADEVREFLGYPVEPSCGARCQKHNDSIKGSVKNSQHVKGRAMDLPMEHADVERAYNYLDQKYPNKYGMGKYYSFLHVDTKTKNKARRW